MFERVQIIKENDQAQFAVIPFDEYLFLRELWSDKEKMADYLDYLHMQKVKKQAQERFSREEVKRELAIDIDS
jgi:hypothetical protein